MNKDSKLNTFDDDNDDVNMQEVHVANAKRKQHPTCADENMQKWHDLTNKIVLPVFFGGFFSIERLDQ